MFESQTNEAYNNVLRKCTQLLHSRLYFILYTVWILINWSEIISLIVFARQLVDNTTMQVTYCVVMLIIPEAIL